MTLSKATAIAVARACAQVWQKPWDETDLTADITQVGDTLCWRITTSEAADPAEPWFEQFRSPIFIAYLIDQSARCIGFEHDRSRTILPLPWALGDPARRHT